MKGCSVGTVGRTRSGEVEDSDEVMTLILPRKRDVDLHDEVHEKAAVDEPRPGVRKASGSSERRASPLEWRFRE